MVKVLIYSSKETYDTVSYEGRAEADIIAYAVEDGYVVLKDRTTRIGSRRVYGKNSIAQYIRWAEHDEFNREVENIKTAGMM